MSVHALSLLGLIMNGLGALALVFCPPPVLPREIMENGVEKIPQTHVLDFFPTEKKKWKHLVRLYGFRTGVGLLFAGFLLQIIVELSY